MTAPMRTRIAPSPTGSMHIGTLRTVLYDYFLARQSGGQFIVRIEDTDQGRLVPGAMEGLFKLFAEFGIDYDEGPVMNADGAFGEKGAFGPYIQSQRLDIYKKYADQLVAQGDAYPCFCSPERLEQVRAEAMLAKRAARYDRHCLGLSAQEVQSRIAAGESHVIRLKVPEGESRFVDAIRGEIVFQNTEVDDQVLMKSDGFPTYHLAVVVDDHLMQITHILRGEEWITSTPKQLILFKMFGWEAPVFAHVPVLLNPNKTKLSKRNGDVAAETFLEKGYLPDALKNFLALLGWNPRDDREIYTMDELIALFDLAKVNKAGAVVNMEKLNWMNAQYIKALSPEAYNAYVLPHLPAHEDAAFRARVAWLARERLQLASEASESVGWLLQPQEAYETALLAWKTQSSQEVAAVLTAWNDEIATWDDAVFADVTIIETRARAFVEQSGRANGETLWPLRVALSGRKQSPSPFELLWALGRERALARVDEALSRLAY